MGREANEQRMNRREFLALAAAAGAMLMLPGCEPYMSEGPSKPPKRQQVAAYASTFEDTPQTRYIYVQQVQTPAPAPARVVRTSDKVSAMSRNSWGANAAVPTKMKAMNGVTRITIHHEGSAKPNNDTTPAAVAKTLRLIQSQHCQRMGAGDIGYHFIIDRTGTIWQGRDWRYQGAHVSKANANNIGVMLLGNFEIQQPTAAQLDSLYKLTASLSRKFGLNPAKDIYGHSDFGNTQCPGKNLKPQVALMRKSL